MNTPDVTIVVCTYNRAARLRGALESLVALELDGTTAEVLVVDNNSSDDTAAVVAAVGEASPIPVRRVLETIQGIVPARNRGVAEARGEWIAFFDDDQLAEPDWIVRLLELAKRRVVRCVGGAVDLMLPEGAGPVEALSPIVRMLLGETVRRTTEREYTQRFTPGCGNLMVHRSVFDRVGTFNPRMDHRGEDTDLWMRIHAARMRGWYTPRAVVHHVIPAERLQAEYLLRLSDLMAEGMAEDEHEEWGGRYPLVWLARLGQYLGVLWPRFVWAAIRRDQPRLLGSRCRLRIARHVLVNGLRSMLVFRRDPGPAEVFETTQPRPTT